MKELLSVTAEDVEAFCIYDTDNEVFIKAFRSSADVYEDDIEGNSDQDPDNYYCWDYETFTLENINSTYEEAVQLIGKILSYEYKGERISRSVFEVSARGNRVKIDRTNQATWMERNATIDGQPFGVLVTD